jgi:opacity protein-like surface antigen
MRKIGLALATAAAVVATPALARDGAVYVGAELGVLKADDTDIDVGNVEDAITLDYRFDLPDDAGWDAAAFAGYDFGGFRLEAEVAKKKARIESLTSTIGLPGAGAGTYATNGKTDVMSYMLNGMLDFGDDDGTSAFIGAGAGYATVDLENLSAFANTPVFLDDSDNGFAWQLFAGVRQALSDTVDMHVKYRYFNAGSLDIDDGVTAGDMKFSSHSVLGGISFNFGGAEAPPPPVAPTGERG